MLKWRFYSRFISQLLILLGVCFTLATSARGNRKPLNHFLSETSDGIVKEDNCKSEKLRELVLETVGIYPHQYSYQAKYMKQQAEERFGNWWSVVIVGDRGGYGMSAIYDQFRNTRCSLTHVFFQ
ncbi:hypothetical protein DICVIV_03631 [Dictyocaulus viviparus]|uniref:Uncharacterized protein n=1 Tax=Dictyocaulus viviparus TaxID=29172 RepID=A0A0D8Y220_DICVI|nr:hypothetical protein DICVIV_03631 [Dictyocaulus viviparus]